MRHLSSLGIAALATLGLAALATAADGPAPTKAHSAGKPAATVRKARSTPFYLSGVWVLADTFMDKQDKSMVATPGRLTDTTPAEFALFFQAPVLKGEYQERHEKAVQLTAQGKAIDDQGAMCLPQGMPAFWIGPYAFEFVQTKTQLNVSQEWNEQTRRIYLDGRPHSADYDPSYNGHSIGHWEGGELVVDTSGIRADTKIGLDSHHSDLLHIVERMTLLEPDLLQVEMRAFDPKAFMQPWVAIYKLRRKPGMELQEYSCEDNNRNAVDANGETQAIIQPNK